MTTGWRMICSPCRPNSSTSVSSSAESDSGASVRSVRASAACPPCASSAPPPKLRHDHRHDDVEHDRQNQRVPGHRDRGQAEQQRHDRREGNDHDRVVERHLRQREMRLAIDEVRPDEHHGRAGSRRQQDQPGDIAVDLIGGQIGPEQMRDEQPAEQRHGERLDQPVDADRRGDAAPMFLTCPRAARSIFSSIGMIISQTSTATGRLTCATVAAPSAWNTARHSLPEGDADDDAERNP